MLVNIVSRVLLPPDGRRYSSVDRLDKLYNL
jgi:hypothetical protein